MNLTGIAVNEVLTCKIFKIETPGAPVSEPLRDPHLFRPGRLRSCGGVAGGRGGVGRPNGGADAMSGEAAWADDVSNFGRFRRGLRAAALSEGDLVRLTQARLSRQSLDLTPGGSGPPAPASGDATRPAGCRWRAGDGRSPECRAPVAWIRSHALISARLAAGRVASAREPCGPRCGGKAPCRPMRWKRPRARIAMHQNDLSAARAILVRWDRTHARGLPRSGHLMLEVLMAGGNAAHAREVTTRLGWLPPPHRAGPRGRARSGQDPHRGIARRAVAERRG